MLTKPPLLTPTNSIRWPTEVSTNFHFHSMEPASRGIMPIEDVENFVDNSFHLDDNTPLDGAQVIGGTSTRIHTSPARNGQ